MSDEKHDHAERHLRDRLNEKYPDALAAVRADSMTIEEHAALCGQIEALTERLAEAQAVIAAIEEWREWADREYEVRVKRGTFSVTGKRLDAILAQSPTDALEAHDQQVAAKALTDAADEMREILRFRTLGGPTDEWLRARAASIASGEVESRG